MKQHFVACIFAFATLTLQAQAVPPKPSIAPTQAKALLGHTFSLQKAPLASVVTVVYGEILKEPFLLDEVVKDNPVTINFKNAQPETLRVVLDDYLRVKGIQRTQRGGINLFVPLNSVDQPAPVFNATAQPPQAHAQSSSPGFEKTVAPEEKLDSEHVHKVYRVQHRPAAELIKIATALAPKSQVIADDLLLVVAPEKLSLIQSLLDQYDTARGEITVKATVVEYTNSKDHGAGFFGAIKLLGDRLSINIGDSKALSNVANFKFKNLEAVISAINQDSNFSVIDTSTLRILSGKTGSLTVGQEVPALSSVTQDNKGNPVQNIQYRSGGLEFKVTPITAGDRVTAEIMQSLSSFAVTRTSNIDSPTQLRRTFTSHLSADFGEVILLGGLDEVKTSNATNSLFGLKLGSNRTDAKTTLFLVLQFLKA